MSIYGRKPLKEIQDWVAFNKIISEIMKEHNLCDCSDCSWSGIGVIPGRKEKHCLDHAREGKCWFYKRHRELVDNAILKSLNSEHGQPESWHNYGYGFCAEALEFTEEGIERLIGLVPWYKNKVNGSMQAHGITTPTVDDYLGYTDDCQYGIADFLVTVMVDQTGLNFIACDDEDGNGYVLFVPDYPWNMNEYEKSLTQEDVAEIIRKYVSILSDTPIVLEYLGIANGT